MKLALALAAMVQSLAVPLPFQSPETSIKQVLRNQVDAWNSGDIRKFMLAYEDSPRTALIGKDITRGYAQVLGEFVEKLENRQKNKSP